MRSTGTLEASRARGALGAEEEQAIRDAVTWTRAYPADRIFIRPATCSIMAVCCSTSSRTRETIP